MTTDNRPPLPPRPSADLYEFPVKHLKHGGGGGTFDGMEARINRLEEDMKEARTDLKAIRSEVSVLVGMVRMLPGWPGLLTITGVIIASVGLMIRFL